MESLPAEIINEILLIVDRPTLYHASQVCCQWRQLSLTQVIKLSRFKDFTDACRRGDRLSVIKCKFYSCLVNGGLYNACKGGHKDLVELMIAKGADDYNLYSACQGGHKEIVELMIAKGGDDYNYGLEGACLAGHKEIVELMTAKGADNWNYGLEGACQEEHKELVDLMIIKGATECNCGKSLEKH